MPAPLPLPPGLEHAPDERPRLKRSCALILARLQAGPATALELQVAGGGQRIGARILELRRRGYAIQVAPQDRARGIWQYRLEV